MYYLFDGFINKCIDNIGYETLVRIKDAILFISGVAIGMVIMLFLAGRILHKVEKVDNLGKFAYMELKDNKRVHVYININSIYHAMELLLMLIFLKYPFRKSYSIRDEKRAKLIARIIFTALLILGAISLIFIFNPIIDN